MVRSETWIRIGGSVFFLMGLFLVFVAGDLLGLMEKDLTPGNDELIVRVGFGSLLIGLLTLFLFSSSSVPKEVSRGFLLSSGRNTARTIVSLNLEGNGAYVPPGGRLSEDRVYIPLEKKPHSLPLLNDEMVFSVGSTGPSMGVALIPPGKGLVDEVEKMTRTRFRDGSLSDATENLERLGKGTGLFNKIEVRDKGRYLEVNIVNSRFKDVCDRLWDEFPDLHARIGCPLCSSVLCATARMAKTPLLIKSVEREGGMVMYRVERGE